MKVPNLKKSWEYENNFLISCQNDRIGKILAHYELYKIASKIPGDIILGGVFRGISTVEFSTFVNLFEKSKKRQIIVFDEFSKFPKHKGDIKSETIFKQMGNNGISFSQLSSILKYKKIKNVQLIKGKIPQEILKYTKKHKKLKISLVDLDVDIYDRELLSLKILYPKISKGGILILNDYRVFEFETKLIDEYFRDKNVVIKKLNFSKTPSYIIKK